MTTHTTPESQVRDGSPGALQSVRISDAHTAYAKVLLNTLD